MNTNEKETVQAVKASQTQLEEKATKEKEKTEKPSYQAPKIREIDPAGVLYAAFN